MSESYKAVLKSMRDNPDPDYREFYYKVAEYYPDVFIRVNDAKTRNIVISELRHGGQKVEAIKKVRFATGWSLKDAKCYVDQIQMEEGL